MKLDFHNDIWVKISQLIHKNRMTQALLFVGPRHAKLLEFVNQLMAMINCQDEEPPCGHCQPCRLLNNNSHPDIFYIRPDSATSPIKIDQIRDLQQTIYQTPQCGQHSFIVIEPADKMNSAAANALLKILEEPPKHVYFILMAEQISSILPTVLSRCQMYPIQSPETISNCINYLALGKFYSPESTRGMLILQEKVILTSLSNLVAGNVSPCTIATQWSSYALEDIIWLLYLITSQAIYDHFIIKNNQTESRPFNSLLPSVLLTQLDKMHVICKKMYHNINMNQTLVLEDLLIGYV